VKVTPLDIRRKEFKRSVRGYSDEEVDLFLDEVADEFERLFQENVALQDKIKRLEEQVGGDTKLRDALEKTLVSAQLHADETRANARKESELILRDAELKARGIVADSYTETQRVQQALIQLKRLEEDFRFKFRSLLEGHLKLLEDAPIEIAPGQPAPDATALAEPEETPFEVPAAVEEVPEYAPAPSASVRDDAGLTGGTEDGLPEEDVASAPVPAAVSGDTPVDMASRPEELERESMTAETVDKGSAFEEFDGAGAVQQPAEDFPTGVTEEDTFTGFFASGKLDDVKDVFLDSDKGEKNKARDFEW
jgi:cell division initiation protein